MAVPCIMAESDSVGPADAQPESAPSEQVINALSLLQSPTPSALARSRIVVSNETKKKQQRGPGKASVKTSTLLKNVSVETRIREYKDEPFCKSNNRLFCNACQEVLAVKASIIKRHVDSSKHKSGKTRLAQKEKREATILQAMKKYDRQVHPEGEMLSDNQRV